MARKPQNTRLPAPYLRRVTAQPNAERPGTEYPFNSKWLTDPDLEIQFEQPVTIIAGENGSGKSTLIEALAALAGYSGAGGGKGYQPVDNSRARESDGGALAPLLRAGWLPKVTRGWFFRAETFFAVSRYLDEVDSPSADFLSHSHGEGFVRMIGERMSGQGIYFMDEPESALSPKRQIELLRFLSDIQKEANAQVIIATHSPILMAVPGADLWWLDRLGPKAISYRETPHFRLYQDFTVDPEQFVSDAIEGLF